MSSSPRRDVGRVRRGVGGWSLRARLIAEQVALLTLVCVVIGVVTVFAVRALLYNELDAQLAAASGRAEDYIGKGPPPEGPPGGHPPPIDAPGQAAGTLNALIVNGQVVDAQRRTSSGGVDELPADQWSVLSGLPADRKPRTVDLGDFGDFRIIAVRGPEGETVISGLPLSGVDDTLLSVGLILGGVALAGLLAAAVAGALIVRRTLAPLQRVAATAGQVAELPLDRGDVALAVRVPERDTDPRTEVGQVGLALNRMLGHVGNALAVRHASETRVRQFVADASHELRTPLAAVRGYAELVRRSGDTVSPEVSHAMRRVESEAARMTTLVEDLLLLARLDSGRPLEYSTVDLSRLVVDAVSDARIAGGDHQWRLELPAEPVTLAGDEQRLHQVLANLLSNARVHTPPGTVVTTGLSTMDDWVTLTVADDGPGIPADILPEVFERFARGDSSRSRAAGSTGLGLAIVSAVVHAHHGTVEVASRAGRITFTVRLPEESS